MVVLDCYHNDLTAIINARAVARHDRKAARRSLYWRQYGRKYAKIKGMK